MKKKMTLQITGDATELKSAFRQLEVSSSKSGDNLGKSMETGAKQGGLAIKAMAVASGVILANLATKGIGAVIGGLKSAIAETAELEYTTKKAAAVAGGGYDEMYEKARRIGAATAYTAQQAAEGFFQLASQGHDTNRILAETQSIMMLAGATSTDLASAFKTAALQARIFGADVSQTDDIVDVLATATLKSAYSSLEELSETLTYASPAASAFGYSLQQTAAGSMTFMNVLGQASMAGTQFRMVMMKLGDDTSQANKILQSYGVEVKNAQGNVRDLGEIIQDMAAKGVSASDVVSGFGARASTAMLALVSAAEDGRDIYGDSMNEINQANGKAASVYQEMMDTLKGAWMMFKSQVMETKFAVLDFAGGALQVVIEKATKGIAVFNRTLRATKDSSRDIIITLGEFAIAEFDYLSAYIPRAFESASIKARKSIIAIQIAIAKVKEEVGSLMWQIGDIAKPLQTIAKYSPAGGMVRMLEKQGYMVDAGKMAEKGQGMLDESASRKSSLMVESARLEEENKRLWAEIEKARIESGAKEKWAGVKGGVKTVTKTFGEYYASYEPEPEPTPEAPGKTGQVGGNNEYMREGMRAMLTQEGELSSTRTAGSRIAKAAADAERELAAVRKAEIDRLAEYYGGDLSKRDTSKERMQDIARKKATRMYETGTTTGTVDWEGGRSAEPREIDASKLRTIQSWAGPLQPNVAETSQAVNASPAAQAGRNVDKEAKNIAKKLDGVSKEQKDAMKDQEDAVKQILTNFMVEKDNWKKHDKRLRKIESLLSKAAG